MESKITPQLREKLAEQARELAHKVEAGMKFQTGMLFSGEAPHCVLGCLASRSGLAELARRSSYSGLSKFDEDKIYELLEEAAGTSERDAKAHRRSATRPIYNRNDDLFSFSLHPEGVRESKCRNLAQSLREYADKVLPIKNLNSDENLD